MDSGAETILTVPLHKQMYKRTLADLFLISFLFIIKTVTKDFQYKI